MCTVESSNPNNVSYSNAAVSLNGNKCWAHWILKVISSINHDIMHDYSVLRYFDACQKLCHSSADNSMLSNISWSVLARRLLGRCLYYHRLNRLVITRLKVHRASQYSHFYTIKLTSKLTSDFSLILFLTVQICHEINYPVEINTSIQKKPARLRLIHD